MKGLSFSRIAAVMVKEFTQLRRDRITYAMILVMPLVQLLLFGYAINTDPRHLPAAVVSYDHSRIADDIVATLMLNMFYGGRMKGMPPKLVSDDGKHVVIRPLCYVPEKDTARWAQYQQFPIIPCNLCGSQDGLQRVAVNEMLREWDKKFPGRLDNMLHALQNVVPSHLADQTHYDFQGLALTGVPSEDGDRAFDPEEFPSAGELPGVQVIKL